MNVTQIDLFLIVLIVATTADLLVPIIIATQYPGYSHFSDTISTLGTSVSPVKKYQCLNLIIVGLLFIVFSVGQALSFRHIAWCHVLYILGIGVFGLGTIMAGIFPEDPQEWSDSDDDGIGDNRDNWPGMDNGILLLATLGYVVVLVVRFGIRFKMILVG